ncbi:MAG: hypothetical protein A3B74_03375 [Candidatus Kerfeldbacteria bacterium RIFCSPHIGHO2_02_FULL_42_14]|uniref:Nudix hydrolase domain-containing protein n=1 Tax=Candidatus Kerfeldbacteria bacterium RIFCSPHIGHO2_02_FULL_42_14 TaxID=1798540 RepID=A0A1G2ARZ9_9BACT|nr:MAG: hypothetical protein A3B74_03375 [Candidatus Kerfeldbacteria bacterium RIFCSPHIGHO2_02_FULL_42_14]OGY80945.1 MAG: hypothetical protein A3E60_03285 [Candidatus Kerfeldbacteria bacterium RIFCSPHIGHO2_12_FULL_42_13]OGY84179.1 MAG: hypothetical protein A3I91_01690 [Candidatus Kerfeldbacteria bacterium RIFCSPLOWO2_02_FULL_42_19]
MERSRPKIIASALVENNGRYLFAKETLEDGEDYWIVPGGKVEFGESLETAAKREMKEETHLDIAIVRFIAFQEAIHVQHDYHTIIFFFLARPKTLEMRLDSKILEAKFFAPEEFSSLRFVESARWLLRKLQLIHRERVQALQK